MTENLTNPTAIQCKNKFLKFVDALSKYPPMTFQEYRDADSNHINWFSEQATDDYLSYRQWFTLAVLNNFEFMLRIKQQHPDAINLFESIINSNYHLSNVKYCTRIFGNGGLPDNLINDIKNFKYFFNFDYNCSISELIEAFNTDLQHGNVNKTSSAIQFKNNLIALQQQHNLINELKVKHYTRDIKILRNFYNFVEERKKYFNAKKNKIIDEEISKINTRTVNSSNEEKKKFYLSVKKRLSELKSQQRNNKEIIDAVKKRINADDIEENLRKIFKKLPTYKLMDCRECEISNIVRSTIIEKPSISSFDRYNTFSTNEEIFIYNGVTVRSLPIESYLRIYVDDISNIYDIQILSDSELLFSCSKLTIRYYNLSGKYFTPLNNATATLSLLMENIEAVLNN